ncbi:hypothetical protein ACFVIN_01295 [Streptomyces prasinus]|uniref:hypothetical protein n=1 Tax=Streptomyces prasinus TaxID=67345 RepID=UPI0036419B77
MEPGDKIRLRGSAGALFLVTVGQPFTKELIERRLESGEWSWPQDEPAAAQAAGPAPRTEEKSKPAPGEDSPKPRTELTSERDEDGPPPQPRQEIVSGPDTGSEDGDPDRPAQSASKSEWVAYVARTQHMSREDAANYTKADLIDMAK